MLRLNFSNYLAAALLFAGTGAVAQLPYAQTFTGTTAPGLVFGGVATLTAGAGDPVGGGYLRLTPNATASGGYVYNNTPFPAYYGLKVSFEYFAYGGTNPPADGFSFFLFDATTPTFNIGSYGGALGYTFGNGPGVSNGYLGIGLDVYGNFTGAGAHTVGVRGPGNGNSGYPLLAYGSYAPGVSSGTGTRVPAATSPGYRKVIIELAPKTVAGGYSYDITVKIVSGAATPVTTTVINNYTGFSTVAPANLKYGFAGSTGSLSEAHEVRNLNVEAFTPPTGIPVANNDNFSACGPATAQFPVLNNDAPVNMPYAFDSTSVRLVDPANSSLTGSSYTISGVGTFSTSNVFGSKGLVTFVPDVGFTGSASINYVVKDNYGQQSLPATLTVTAGGTAPDVTSTPSSQTIANSTAFSIVNSGSIAGTVFSWTRNNTGTISGIAASGTGNISGTLTNTTSLPVTVTFTTTPSYTNAGQICTGTPVQSNVTVNPGQEIEIRGNSTTIADGDATPDLADHTDFATGPASRTFTVRNTGNAALSVGTVTISGVNASDFTVTGQPAGTVAANNGTTTFTIAFLPSASGLRTATVNVPNNDPDESPYDFAIAGTGEAGAALNFDGSNDQVPIGAALPAGSSYTKEAWVRTNINSGQRNVLSSFPDPFWVTGGKLSAGNNGNHTLVQDPATFPLNTWTHIAVTYDAPASTMRLYKNGALVASSSAAGPYGGGEMYIGNHYSAVSSIWSGDIDELRVWNRALCLQEIQNNMNGSLPNPTTQPGLVAYYPMSQGAASGNNTGITFLTDASTGGHNGTLTNFAKTGSTSNFVTSTVANTPAAAYFAPEIDVQGNFLSIVDGDNTPSAADHTAFGSIEQTLSLARTYTIQNTGTLPLNVSSITSGNTQFAVGTMTPAGPIAAGNSATFTVTYVPTTASAQTAVITVNNDDCNEAVYDFAVSGSGYSYAARPHFVACTTPGKIEIAVTGPSTGLQYSKDGGGSYQASNTFSATTPGTYTVRIKDANGNESGSKNVTVGTINTGRALHFNTGVADEVDISGVSDAGYSNGLTFVGWMKPLLGSGTDAPLSTPGRFSINYLANNDYFQVNGGAPLTSTVNNGEYAHIAITITAGGALTTYHNGVRVATGTAQVLQPGDVVKLAGFTLWDEVQVWNKILTPAEIGSYMSSAPAGNEPGLVAYYDFNQGTAGGINTGVTTLTDLAGGDDNGTLNGNFSLSGCAGNWVNFTCPCVPLLPEINLQGNNVTITDGDITPSAGDHTAFGNVPVGTTLTRTFTIQNTGNAALDVSSMTSGNPLFTIGALTPASPVAASGSATFTVTFSPTALGSQSAVVTVNNNDADESVYDFTVQGDGVCALPLVYAVTGGGAYCSGGPGAAVGLGNSETGVDYQLKDGAASIGAAVAGTGSAISFGDQAAAATYTVVATRTAGGCTSNMSGSATVSVNPVPNAVATPSAQTRCSGTAIGTISFSGNVAGTVYNWTRDNTAGATGIAVSGAGNIAGTLTNTTNAPVVVTFTITPSYTNGGATCAGTPVMAAVTVNPVPNVVRTPVSQTICSGAALTTISLTSNVSGTVFNWSRSNTATTTGITASGSGNISGSLTNTTSAAVSSTFLITPSYTNAGGTCTGSSTAAAVTVNPAPNVIAAPASQTVCNGSAIAAIVSSGSVAGTVYNWTRDNTATVTGITASGSGNISGTLTNTTATPVPVLFTITPSSTIGGTTCTGTPAAATVMVNPTPNLDQPAGQVVCNSAPTAAVTFTTTVTGITTSYNWTNNSPSIGLPASGTGDIAAFTATNGGNAPVTATITVTPSIGGGLANLIVNGGFESGNLSGWTNTPSAGANGWVINNGSFVPPGSGTATAPISGGYDVVTTQGGPGLNLLSSPATLPATLTSAVLSWKDRIRNQGGVFVNPTQQLRVQLLNSSQVVIATVFQTNPGDPVIQDGPNSRSYNVLSILAPYAGQQVYLRFAEQDDQGYFNVTIDDVSLAVNSNCSGPSKSFTVTVNPTPAAVATPSTQIACTGTPITPVQISGNVSGALYNWTRNGASATGIAAAGSGTIAGTLSNATNAAAPVTFTIIPSYTNAGATCAGTAVTATVTVPTLVTATAAVTPLYPMAGQEIQTIYTGYPGSAQSVDLSMTPAGGTAPYTYSMTRSSCNVATVDPAFSYTGSVSAPYPFTPGTVALCNNPGGDNIYTFRMTAIDVNGCLSAVQMKKINVVNPYSGADVMVCHRNVSRGSTTTQMMTLAPSAVATHLAHGDYLGNCQQFTGARQVAAAAVADNGVHVYPNPTTGSFKVALHEIMESADIIVTDVQGSILARRTLAKDASPVAEFDLAGFSAGMYLISVKDGEMLYRTKIVLR